MPKPTRHKTLHVWIALDRHSNGSTLTPCRTALNERADYLLYCVEGSSPPPRGACAWSPERQYEWHRAVVTFPGLTKPVQASPMVVQGGRAIDDE